MDLVGQSEQGLKGTVHPKNPKHITLPVVPFIVLLVVLMPIAQFRHISCGDG